MITPEEKAALMAELLEELDAKRENERRSRQIITKILDEVEQKEAEFSPVNGYHMRNALSTMLRAVFQVKFTAKIPAEMEETARAFVKDAVALIQMYRDEKGA